MTLLFWNWFDLSRINFYVLINFLSELELIFKKERRQERNFEIDHELINRVLIIMCINFFSEWGLIRKERKNLNFILMGCFDNISVRGGGGYMSVVAISTTAIYHRQGVCWKPFCGWHGSLKQHSCLPPGRTKY